MCDLQHFSTITIPNSSFLPPRSAHLFSRLFMILCELVGGWSSFVRLRVLSSFIFHLFFHRAKARRRSPQHHRPNGNNERRRTCCRDLSRVVRSLRLFVLDHYSKDDCAPLAYRYLKGGKVSALTYHSLLRRFPQPSRPSPR